jgi:deazaflavin-dependent oxidoreductase (nitroreductase family)
MSPKEGGEMDQQAPKAREPLTASRFMVINRRIAGPIWRRVGVTAILEVPGRRTARPQTVTLIAWEVDGVPYLMSQYGVTAWVRNLRAAGRGELLHKGRTQAVNAIEVEGDERDRVIAAFEKRTPKPFRRDFDQRPDAADHPTFRLEPIS